MNNTKTDGKLSYCSTTSIINLQPFTIRDRLYHMAELYPNKVVYIFNQNNGLELTYLDVKQKATLLAKNFMNLNLQKGDRIAYLLPNTHELLISYFAASFVGLVSVPLDPDYGSNELEYMLKKTDPKAIIIYDCPEYQKIINDLFPELETSKEKEKFKSTKFDSLEHLIFINDSSKMGSKYNLKNVWPYNKIACQLLNETNEEFPYIDTDDLFGILFTSGTTFRPKGVKVSQFGILNNVSLSGNTFKDTTGLNEKKETTQCVTLLMYHMGVIWVILSTLFDNKTKLVFASKKFHTKDIIYSIHKYRCNSITGLPKILLNILNDPERDQFDLSSLTSFGSSGQMVSTEVIKRFKKELGLNFCFVAYGMTEINVASRHKLDLTNWNPCSNQYTLGRVGPMIEAKIINPTNGNIQPLNTEGELHVRGYNVTRGYYNDEEITNKYIDKNGWLNTTDIMTMDESGCLYFKSRSKEVITAKGSGRLDVYPGEVEECLLSNPKVNEAVVFGVSINDYEQEVCAWIRLESNEQNTDPKEIIEFCRGKLVDFKIPKYLKFVNQFPINLMGKYLRSEMEKLFRTDLKL